eukprot:Lankesteria_metandrocarpae@DN7074_c0_g1_i1.p1
MTQQTNDTVLSTCEDEFVLSPNSLYQQQQHVDVGLESEKNVACCGGLSLFKSTAVTAHGDGRRSASSFRRSLFSHSRNSRQTDVQSSTAAELYTDGPRDRLRSHATVKHSYRRIFSKSRRTGGQGDDRVVDPRTTAAAAGVSEIYPSVHDDVRSQSVAYLPHLDKKTGAVNVTATSTSSVMQITKGSVAVVENELHGRHDTGVVVEVCERDPSLSSVSFAPTNVAGLTAVDNTAVGRGSGLSSVNDDDHHGKQHPNGDTITTDVTGSTSSVGGATAVMRETHELGGDPDDERLNDHQQQQERYCPDISSASASSETAGNLRVHFEDESRTASVESGTEVKESKFSLPLNFTTASTEVAGGGHASPSLFPPPCRRMSISSSGRRSEDLASEDRDQQDTNGLLTPLQDARRLSADSSVQQRLEEEKHKRLTDTLRDLIPPLSALQAKRPELERRKVEMLEVVADEKALTANTMLRDLVWDMEALLEQDGVELFASMADAMLPSLRHPQDADAMKMIAMWTADHQTNRPIVISPKPSDAPPSKRRRFFRRMHSVSSGDPPMLQAHLSTSVKLSSEVMGFTGVTLFPSKPVRSDKMSSKGNKATERHHGRTDQQQGDQTGDGRIDGLKTPYTITEACYPLYALPAIGFGHVSDSPMMHRNLSAHHHKVSKKDSRKMFTKTSMPTTAGQRAELPILLEVEIALRDRAVQEKIVQVFSSAPTRIASQTSIALSVVPESHAFLPSVELPPQSATWIWLANFMESLINNAEIHRMRVISELVLFSVGCMVGDISPPDKTWGRSAAQSYEGRWKMWDDSCVAFILNGTLDASLHDLLCLLNEADLHKTWIPFLGDSKAVHKVSEYSQIVSHYSALPWPLHDKETLILGFGTDALLEDGLNAIVMTGLSVPGDAGGLWGFRTSKPTNGVDRMDINHFALSLAPSKTERNKTVISLFLYVKTNLYSPPSSLQNFLGRTACSKLFATLKKLCDGMKGSVHEKRQQQNQEFYDNLAKRHDDFWKKYHD